MFDRLKTKLESELDILEYPLLVLRLLGIYSETIKAKVIFTTLVCYISPLIFLEVVCLMQFVNSNRNVFEFVRTLEVSATVVNLLGKMSFIIVSQKKFALLVSYTEAFAKVHNRKDLHQIHQNNVYMQLYIFVSLTVALLLAFLFGDGLVMGMWTTDDLQTLYNVFKWTQVATFSITVLFVYAYGCCYFGFCTKAVVQFRLLASLFNELNLKETYERMPQELHHLQMTSCIEYHVYLLKFLKRLKEFYSPIMLVEYCAITPVICAEIYIMFESEELLQSVRGFMLVVVAMLDVAFYSIPASFVTDEALQIADALYNSEWYLNSSRTLRQLILFVIQRSQEECTFTAGGLMNCNVRSLVSVLKAAYSACAVMRAMKQ